MDKIPTAEEFLSNVGTYKGTYLEDDVLDKLKEFAKLHVKAQVQAITHQLDLEGITQDVHSIVENSYPDENIK
jgi:hypothetical protein